MHCHLAGAFFFFFLLPFDLDYFSSFAIILNFITSCFFRKSSHYSSNCFFFVCVFSSMAYCRSFFVCSLSRITPEMSYSRRMRFLSINYL